MAFIIKRNVKPKILRFYSYSVLCKIKKGSQFIESPIFTSRANRKNVEPFNIGIREILFYIINLNN